MSKNLRKKIIDVLITQGFNINPHAQPYSDCKNTYRDLHKYSRNEQIRLHLNFLKNNSKIIQNFLLNENKLNPLKIDLELREVTKDSLEETIFRWWNLIWWSIPYQRAYGRQLRFLLWDKGHNVPFGLIGLQSPILKMSVRDDYLNLPREKLDLWVNKSMQAQRLGALPPYNYLLGGKMAAMAMTSNELRKSYRNKYMNQRTELRERIIDPDLLFITTTSAFGKSSIYNRLKYNNEILALSLGYTKGAGSFHIPEKLYREIQEFLSNNGINVNTTFGNGPSRKIKLLYTAFRLLKIPDYSYHNLKREFFLFPLVSNLKDVIHKNDQPKYFDRPLNVLVNYWRERLCLPRAERNIEWMQFDAQRFFKNQLEKNGIT